MKNYSDKLFADGFVHVPNFFSSDEIIYIEAPRSFNKNLKLYFIDKNIIFII